jgi:hypothetical protein
VGEDPADDGVGHVEGERGPEQRLRVEVGRHEAQPAQPREDGRQAHRTIDARRSGGLSSADTPRPTGAAAEVTAILKRLYGLGEEHLGRLVEELLANPRFADAFARAFQTALATKGRMDRNMQTLLALLNLPSRKDLTRLLTKLEAIQGSLVNLNLKVDRLLAAQPGRRRRSPRKAPDEARE